ncbi:hypothetical protein BO99DRAFT_254786 [Aspergillus violaceofuscus CBS 115571]|uniref:Uncharacterized protein n=1 Tax=Aspergillus violaceofuscus (strain CBS 115571) TaxID=1450538 RepID=A0A2V5HTW6_ASPV1|nr:hypothetical protein BO99DRAFT_254786 [Aspergillus violaceofuscus CBS 115571]
MFDMSRLAPSPSSRSTVQPPGTPALFAREPDAFCRILPILLTLSAVLHFSVSLPRY